MRQMLVPGPFLIWCIIQHSHYMQEIILNIRNFETGLSKRINRKKRSWKTKEALNL